METHIKIAGRTHLIKHNNNHQELNKQPASLHTFLAKIDHLATAVDSPACPPNRSNLSHCPPIAVEIIKTLYAFAFQPEWAPHFFPINQIINDNQTAVIDLPDITDKFTLTSLQGEQAIEYAENRRGKPCGHVFQKGEGVYHCSDCGIDPTCALCARCFLASDHTGHDVTYSIHANGCGCCDCGDEEAWKNDIKCKYHSLSSDQPELPLPEDDRTPSPRSTLKPEQPLPSHCKDLIEEIVAIALDFLLITVDRSPEDMKPPANIDAIYHELSRLEENAFLGLPRSSPSLPDNSMDIDLPFSHHPTSFQLQHQAIANSMEEAGKSSISGGLLSAFLGGKATDKGKGKITDSTGASSDGTSFATVPAGGTAGRFNSYSSSTGHNSSSSSSKGTDHWSTWSHFPTPMKPTDHNLRGSGPWGVVLWNDERHSYAQVIDQVSKAVGCSRAEALRIASTIDTKGREVIQVSNDPSVLIQTSKTISQIDLTVTVRTAHDLFCEQIAELLINFLVDLASCRIYNVPAEEESWLKSLITRKLRERPALGYEGGGRSRFARLLLNDVKLWKEARDKLKSLYISLLALGQSVKLELGILFASVFPQLIEYNFLVDREPEHNILLFSLQIVTVPSVIVILVKEHGFLKTIIDLLYSFFTHQFLPAGVAENEYKHIVYPPDYQIRRINPEGMSFRHKRYYHLFHELNLVLSSPGVQKAICEDVEHLKTLINFLSLFTNMNPNKRAVHLHVEFESDAWVTAFNLTIQLAKLCKFFGECYSKANPEEFVMAVRTLVPSLMDPEQDFHNVQFGSCENIDSPTSSTSPSSPPTSSSNNDYSGVSYRCIDFRTDRELISFHHPLNWLFAEIMRSSHLIDFTKVHHLGIFGVADLLIPENATPEEADVAPLALSENVICVASLLAQVRAGLWVRNGFGVRAQQLHYREYSLRETTFDQDIFHLQVLLAAKDPNHVLVGIVDRFGMRQWCNGEFLSDRVYEPSQMIAMLEELLHLLIILLSEPSGISGNDRDENLKREIIQILCLGPMSYSDTIKRIPDRYIQDSSFDKALVKLADFKPPVGSNDVGIYSIKPEFLEEVDPYYCRYGRNQREESERIVVEYLKKTTGLPDPVLVPKCLNINSGPFACIGHTYHSEVLLQIIFYSLARVNPTMKGYSEYLADEAIHLVMMGLVEQPEVFAKLAMEKKLPLKGANPHTMTLKMMLEAVDAEPAMKSVQKKVNWCLDKMASIIGVQRTDGKTTESANNAEQIAIQADEQKKIAAKARQNAIMNQFAAAQQAFLLQHDLDDEDDDDEDDDDQFSDGQTSTSKMILDPEIEKTYGNCIVCQEDLTKSRCFGALGLIQRSRMVRLTPVHLEPEQAGLWLEDAIMTPDSLDVDGRKNSPAGVASRQPVNLSDTKIGADGSLEPVPWYPRGFPNGAAGNRSGLFASVCGHLMHFACFQTYYKSIELRHGTQVTRNHPESIDRCEYLCPLCKSIGNVFLPSVDPSPSSTTTKKEANSSSDLAEWICSVEDIETRMKSETGVENYDQLFSLNEYGVIQSWEVHPKLDSLDRQPFSSSSSNTLNSIGVEERAMLERFLTVTAALNRESPDPVDALGPDSSGPSSQATLTRDLIGYTLACTEISSRGIGQPISSSSTASLGVARSITETQHQLISSLLSVLSWLLESENRYSSYPIHQFLTGLLIRQISPSNLLSFKPTLHHPLHNLYRPIFFSDPLSLLVHGAISDPSHLDTLIPALYLLELFRAIISLCFLSQKFDYHWWSSTPDPIKTSYSNVDDRREKEGKALKVLLGKMVVVCGAEGSVLLDTTDTEFDRLIRLFTLPFLRRIWILKNVIHPCSQSTHDQSIIEDEMDEHIRLRKWMNIPNFSDLKIDGNMDDSDDLNESRKTEELRTKTDLEMYRLLMIGWFSELKGYVQMNHQMNGIPAKIPTSINGEGNLTLIQDIRIRDQFFKLEQPNIYELLGLPIKFDKLLSRVSVTKCMNCQIVPNDPGICLFCGATVCVQAFCCTNRNLDEEPEHGECNVHMWNCGGSVGAYLLIKKCSTLFLAAENGAFSMAPYLDEHGEHDVGMKRGRPQFLHYPRWDEIRRVWLNHSIPTFVARRQESSTDVGGWPTF
ncbi:hypothetical protein MJO29_016281 [Puccinia striiformis f. sp. tritici]|uniref:E3 ubiquitin-protein ligase n=1 Tax=Puccinia striiformis f. sp. tritici PST-78 TaxID=1165861 RepID=A0A0L0VZE4_9BASI|nr:hypothetical protein Pst134EA_030528 [Puccinia striiformis f. sp. tritici]KAH9440457.1 hypothetical protein Pst134EB_031069 [Puccinia striiformis f. sp. tritici]KAH9446617.1 hypothetical protein Pst134EA_030528 [Puccinia striiformis f. sp. tritici]KAI7935018.1 hypothetical protein MJO29_016281 [Puccinia striiformis f. sp. tritici]KNF04628.1 hypothetical protein PSTG_02116 [Puccinia striiformis f. sp. tritici PST-78]